MLVATLVSLALAGPARAQGQNLQLTQVQPAVAGSGSGADITFCISCHGQQGLPSDPAIPIIQGQHFYYLYVQLKDYKAGRRVNSVMSGIVANLAREDMKALAQAFSEGPWPATGYTTPESQVAEGEQALVAGQCVQCHRGGYEGDSRVPRLAGQQVGYLEKTMLELKNKIRMNSPALVPLFGAYDDSELKAMAEYLAGW